MRMRPKEMALFLSRKDRAADGLVSAIDDGMNSRRITPERTDLAVMLDLELNRRGNLFQVEDDDDAIKVTLGKKTARLTLQDLVNDDNHKLIGMGAFSVQSN